MAFAGPPVQYGGWEVVDGAIDTSASCSGGVTCSTLVDSNGMLYQQVTAGGFNYFRTIITEANATGSPDAGFNDPDSEFLAFSDESFVAFSFYDAAGNPVNGVPPLTEYNSFAVPQGITDRQIIRDPLDNFVATSEVQRANMRQLMPGLTENGYPAEGDTSFPTEDMFTVRLSQSFDSGELSSDFSHTAYTQYVFNVYQDPEDSSITLTTDPITGVEYVLQDPDTNHVIGSKTDITQTLDISDPTAPAAQEHFEFRGRKGYQGTASPLIPGLGWLGFAPQSYLASEPLVTQGSMNVSGGTDSAVNWANGDSISTTWLVQTTGTTGGALGPVVSYQNVRNFDGEVTDPVTGEVTTQTLEDSAIIFDQPTGTATPMAWDTGNFGAEPTF
jgi:hypothetical protein